jgi:hypothetical protein
MIFTLGDEVHPLELKCDENLHLYCFFSVPRAVSCPHELWFQSVCASLRMKKSVLILEKDIQEYPVWNSTARWEVGDHWLWLSPRSLGPLSDAYQVKFQDLPSLKSLLKLSK